MFNKDIDLKKEAVIKLESSEEKSLNIPAEFLVGKANILKYAENTVDVQTENKDKGFLVLTDSFYPTWHVKIDGEETKIYLTDYNFRGVFVPKGIHAVEFYMNLF